MALGGEMAAGLMNSGGQPDCAMTLARIPVGRDTLGRDAVAGLVFGVEGVPDGLAADLLAGVNPLAAFRRTCSARSGLTFTSCVAFVLPAQATIQPAGSAR